jgi:hypothetical protein
LHGAVLENVVFEEHYREVDYSDKSVTGKWWMACYGRCARWLGCRSHFVACVREDIWCRVTPCANGNMTMQRG